MIPSFGHSSKVWSKKNIMRNTFIIFPELSHWWNITFWSCISLLLSQLQPLLLDSKRPKERMLLNTKFCECPNRKCFAVSLLGNLALLRDQSWTRHLIFIALLVELITLRLLAIFHQNRRLFYHIFYIFLLKSALEIITNVDRGPLLNGGICASKFNPK